VDTTGGVVCTGVDAGGVVEAGVPVFVPLAGVVTAPPDVALAAELPPPPQDATMLDDSNARISFDI